MTNWFVIEWEARQHLANLQCQAQVQRLLREHPAAQASVAQSGDRCETPRAPRTGLWSMLRSAIAGLIA